MVFYLKNSAFHDYGLDNNGILENTGLEGEGPAVVVCGWRNHAGYQAAMLASFHTSEQ